MQVEEDPSSQFLDFTNATDLEQFIADVEQAIIGWHLNGKGHASLEALSAAPPQRVSAHTGHESVALGAAVWTKELHLHPLEENSIRRYTLTLYVSRHQITRQQEEAAAAPVLTTTRKHKKKWQEGLEHFTPTMLSLAHAGRDFQWGSEQTELEVKEEQEEGRTSYYASVLDDDQELRCSRNQTYKKVQKWFGVDEFLLLNRSTLRRSKKQKKENENDEAKETISNVVGPIQREGTEDIGGKSGDLKVHQDDFAMEDMLIDETEAGMLLSALHVALNNCNCTIPAFVPVFEPSRGMWVGSAVPGATGNVSISFDTDVVPEMNSNQSCISGLLDFFKAKLQLSPQVEQKCRVVADASGDLAIGLTVSASFKYSWNRANDPREIVALNNPLAWRTLEPQQPTDIQHQICQIETQLFGEKHSFPYLGASSTPVEGMDLIICWPQLREGSYVDNVVHSTLDLSSAPQWMLSVRFQDLLSENQLKPHLPLSKRMANLVQVYSNSRELNKDITVSELAPPMPPTPSISKSHSGSATFSSGTASRTSLRQQPSSVSESIPAARAAVVLGNAISSLVSVATWKCSDVEEIRRIISDIFDDDVQGCEELTSDGQKKNGGNFFDKSSFWLGSMTNLIQHGAPLGELVSILATRMSQLQSINSMSLLWVEFVKALRERWFQQQLLPLMRTSTEGGVYGHNTGPHSLDTLFLLKSDTIRLPPPDFRQCLLHQKLQLLNWCILSEAQVSRPNLTASVSTIFGRQNGSGAESATASNNFSSDNGRKDDDEIDSSVSDEEFFDSLEQVKMPSPSSLRPEGVLREMPGIVCLQTNEPLLEPVTQTSVPITEDVAKEQQDLFTRLGASVESGKLRHQIQSTALVSDMQAFKAANPRCCLADFIRWYSPKDWIPLESKMDPAWSELPIEGQGVWWFEEQGMLSERMRFGLGHKHIWQELWETSAPVPAKRQKRSFDPVQESEKVYHYLETLSPHELFHQMLAGAISSSVFALETALPVQVSSQNLPVVHFALQDLCLCGNRAIALLDEALAESQVTFSANRRRKQQCNNNLEPSKAAHHQGQQLQVAFEMALDACWKLVRSIENMEALVTKALALLHYFPVSEEDQISLALVNALLLPSLSQHHQEEISKLLKQSNLRQLVTALVLTSSAPSGASSGPAPVQREYVLRCICPRPFLRDVSSSRAIEAENADPAEMQPENELDESPLVICRMYAAFKKNTVRFALALAESEF
uniref:Rab3 GTPase-activating protein catalytic subunit n=1 Tax=Peronospora matthiolae TaxID=2874970 RepID=A0AAV1TSM4_9STRA